MEQLFQYLDEICGFAHYLHDDHTSEDTYFRGLNEAAKSKKNKWRMKASKVFSYNFV